ncbi:MAG TPA: hypothetical protein ENH62_08315 [Marinobacter sp.]|uniref:Uncharacterized protein n=1 Tax=marine sediment metagenome TaxID=412755 RepID=A0A0F9U731_9ZZZZ|nr:hypothetical protein [Marinobacter sp.]
MTKKKTRRSASDIVKGSMQSKWKWFDRLSKEDLNYIQDIAHQLRLQPGASISVVARKLREELDLSVHENSVARKLKELVNAP